MVSIKSLTTRVIASQIPLDYGAALSWSPDGTSIAVITEDLSPVAGQTHSPGQVYIADVPSGGLRFRFANGLRRFGSPIRAMEFLVSELVNKC